MQKKSFIKLTRQLVTVGLPGIFMVITACSTDSPMKPQDENAFSSGNMALSVNDQFLAKNNKTKNTTPPPATLKKTGDYPQFASRDLHYDEVENGYPGGMVNVPGGTKFKLQSGALTPPPGTPAGSTVTITMLVEKDTVNNELIFTFSPHGSQFLPAAEAWIDYTDLGVNNVKAYYINDDGSYTPLKPVLEDRKNKKMMLLIPHFSRYAIAHSQ